MFVNALKAVCFQIGLLATKQLIMKYLLNPNPSKRWIFQNIIIGYILLSTLGLYSQITPESLKARWIDDAFVSLKSGSYPKVKAISWWHSNFDNEDTDSSRLRIDTSPESLEAYRNGVASSVFTSIPQFDANNKLIEPAQNKIYHSAFPDFDSYEDIVTTQRINNFESLANKDITWAYFSNNWGNSIEFPINEVITIDQAGKVPFIRMMPRIDFRNPKETGAADPLYTMENIINGVFDDALTQWAIDAANIGIPLLVEFGTEVNGCWFPWNGKYNYYPEFGESPIQGAGRFKEAYRHIIDICNNNGASNITWFFHINAYGEPFDASWNDIANYYPGDDYIDWLGVSIYGPQRPPASDQEVFQDFSEIMDDTYPNLIALTDKPIAILEFATGPIDVDNWRSTCPNFITNGSFLDEDNHWEKYTYIDENGSANAAFYTGLENAYFFYMSNTHANIENWHVQLYQKDLEFESNSRYLISFDTKAFYNRDVFVNISLAEEPFTALIYEKIKVGVNKWERQYIVFETEAEFKNARLVFDLGNSNEEILLDNVSIEKIGCQDFCNHIENSFLDNGSNFYDTFIHNANADISYNNEGSVNYYISDPGTATWHVQHVQKHFPIEAGKEYTISFKAKSNTLRPISLNISESSSPFTGYYYFNQQIDGYWRTYNHTFKSNINEPDARLVFNLGKYWGNVSLDDIIIIEKDCDAVFADRLEIEAITEITSNIGLKAFASPNPFGSYINISTSKNYEAVNIQIYNIQGKLLSEELNDLSESNTCTINTNWLKSGVYIIKVIAPFDEIGTFKMVK